jgi:hypothetical protein
MDADLDLLCISVYCTADDLLPEPGRNARRKLTDAEVVTLCVAQVLMGIPSDRRFLRAARRQLGHLFPYLPSQDALHKRRARLAETIEWLVGVGGGGKGGEEVELEDPAGVSRLMRELEIQGLSRRRGWCAPRSATRRNHPGCLTELRNAYGTGTVRRRRRSTSQFFGVIRVGRQHSIPPANRDDPAV